MTFGIGNEEWIVTEDAQGNLNFKSRKDNYEFKITWKQGVSLGAIVSAVENENRRRETNK